MNNKKHYDWNQVQLDYNAGLTYRGIAEKYGMAMQSISNARKRGDMTTRNGKEAAKLSGLHGCCAWTTERRSQAAKEQGFGGYQERAGRSKKYYVTDSNGKEVCLQSSFELRCSEILNELNIHWTRPVHFKYIRDEKERKYFPDFLLTDYNIYLDPKNNFLIKQDKIKIDLVCEQNNVVVYILPEEHLTKEHINGLIV